MIDRVVKSRGELLFLLRGEPEVGKEGEDLTRSTMWIDRCPCSLSGRCCRTDTLAASQVLVLGWAQGWVVTGGSLSDSLAGQRANA
jgi:hypothetical protein